MTLRKTLLPFVCCLGLLLGDVLAQPFSVVQAGTFKPSDLGHSGWCDINNDGYPDLFSTGYNGNGDTPDFTHAIIYLNNPDGSFTQSNVTNIPRVIYGSNAWGDFNNDGWADLVVAGTTSGFPEHGITRVYLNNKNETFTQLNATLPGLSGCATLWLDYDNDGWQDLLLLGINTINQQIIKVYRNLQGQTFEDSGIQFRPKGGGRTNFTSNKAIVGDFDNDLDQDIIIGQNATGGYAVEVYENTGGNFVLRNSNLPQMTNASLAAADFNADGKLDVVVNGLTQGQVGDSYQTPATFSVWLGDGQLNFSLMKTFSNQGSYWGSLWAGDMNADGRPDILMNGSGNGSPRSQVFVNQNGNDFISTSGGMQGTYLNDAVAADYDQDGDLDVFVAGGVANSNKDVAILYRNDTPIQNSRPSIPGNIGFSYSNEMITFTWEPASDDRTSAKSISYSVRIGSTEGGSEYVSALSSTNGERQIGYHGNSGYSTSIRLKASGSSFYFQVQSIDASYHESNFSPVKHVCFLPAPEPVAESHYCFGETVLVTAGQEEFEVYADASMTNLLYTGLEYSTLAETSRTIFVRKKPVDGCSALSAQLSYTVSEEPHISLLANGELIDDEITLGRCRATETLTLQAETNYPNITFNGIQSDGNGISISEPQSISVMAKDNYGCSAQAFAEIKFDNYYDLDIPNVITPNGDPKNERWLLPDYPNINLTIYNRYGTSVFAATNYNGEFDAEDLSAGVYYYEVAVGGCDPKKGALHVVRSR